MSIFSVELKNYRNFHNLSLDFSPDVNIITGKNAQGKTNLIEAIFYFSTFRSFRAQKELYLIKHDQPFALLEEKLNNGTRDFLINVSLFRDRPKSVLINGIQERISSSIGILPSILFTPDDLLIVKAGPSERRRLLDIPLCQTRPGYLSALSRYNKVLKMKRLLLKEEPTPHAFNLCSAYNTELANLGGEILCYRRDFAGKLSELANKFHLSISHGQENLLVSYKSFSKANLLSDVRDNTQLLFNRLEELKTSEFATQSCLSGIHKDDLQITINSLPAKLFASQGQMRSIALSLKLAEHHILKDETGTDPVLLLDDVLSELDPERQNFILNHTQAGQTFITCCDTVPFSMLKNGKIITLEGGSLLKEMFF